MAEIGLIEILPLLAAGIVAGLGWSTVGVWSRYKSGLDSTIDYVKLKKNVIIGGVTGTVASIYALTQGSVNGITGIETFALAVIALFPIVILVDKLLTKKEDPDEE